MPGGENKGREPARGGRKPRRVCWKWSHGRPKEMSASDPAALPAKAVSRSWRPATRHRASNASSTRWSRAVSRWHRGLRLSAVEEAAPFSKHTRPPHGSRHLGVHHHRQHVRKLSRRLRPRLRFGLRVLRDTPWNDVVRCQVMDRLRGPWSSERVHRRPPRERRATGPPGT